MRTNRLIVLALMLMSLVLLSGCGLPTLPTPSFTPWTTIYGAARDERSMPDMLFDKAVSTAIKAELMDKNGALGLKVKVYCFLRRVTLLGQVGDADDFKAFALATAWEAEGVRSVAAFWVEPSPAGTTTSDLEIAARLRAALVGDENISATQIEAEVFAGQIYLMGMVRAQKDADRAVAHAQALPGVKSVTSLLIPTQQEQTVPSTAETPWPS
ncbi:MAG: BON domain-containing protein [Proteobacteria bacterium]|nr:BON domain-containing protein [Pseudomonadota bacterium]